MPLIIACQDVQTAFDDMSHELISESMLYRGVSKQLNAALMRELIGLKACMSLPAAGTTPPISYSKGGKQGGVETPEQWLALMDQLLEPVLAVRVQVS